MTSKDKIIEFLTKEDGYNTFSTAQAKQYFGIENVSARISELRREGYPIYTNIRTRADGSKVFVYRLGKASELFSAWLYSNFGRKPIRKYA